MRRKTKASTIALCGILAALALALMFLGGVLPFAMIAAPVLASLILVPVYTECGDRWGLIWFAAVAILGLILAPDKETAILFAFFGYYPVLKKYIGRIRSNVIKWLLKLIYVNAVVCIAYSLMIFVLRIDSVSEEFQKTETWMLIITMVLANVSFILYDLLLDRLTIFYHVKLRPKFKKI